MKSMWMGLIGAFLGLALGAGMVIGYLSFQPVATAGVVSTSTTATKQPVLSNVSAQGVAQASPGNQQTATDPLTSIVTGVYSKVSPSVVSITNDGTLQNHFGSQNVPTEGTGSGIVIDNQGDILTNNHVIANATTLTVAFSDGSTFPAKVVGTDTGNDLAVIKVDAPADKLVVAQLGDSSTVQVGQMAIAIGNPFGFDRSVTTGVVSSLGRTFGGDTNGRPQRDLIQTDAAINPGNSGGPLLNAQGEIIGITSMIESPSGGSVGIGFAIPINTAKQFLPSMLAGSTVDHPRLGIAGQPVTPALAQQLNLAVNQGVYVVSVTAGSSAEQAGIKGAASDTTQIQGTNVPAGGDVITAIDGQAVTKVEDVAGYLDTKSVGDTVKITISRGGNTLDLQAKLGSWSTGQ